MKEENVELRTITGYDRTKVAKLVNLVFILSDIQQGLIMDVEEEIRKADPSLTLPLRHPIERIKEHTSAMVRFVDTKTDETYSEGFGETSDKIKEELFKAFQIV
ncbi:MAG: hypothetical protein ACK5M3_05395 [Dysgonomonas sp.]